jgi:hypothetical protein
LLRNLSLKWGLLLLLFNFLIDGFFELVDGGSASEEEFGLFKFDFLLVL